MQIRDKISTNGWKCVMTPNSSDEEEEESLVSNRSSYHTSQLPTGRWQVESTHNGHCNWKVWPELVIGKSMWATAAVLINATLMNKLRINFQVRFIRNNVYPEISFERILDLVCPFTEAKQFSFKANKTIVQGKRKQQSSEWMNELRDERMNEWINKWMNDVQVAQWK